MRVQDGRHDAESPLGSLTALANSAKGKVPQPCVSAFHVHFAGHETNFRVPSRGAVCAWGDGARSFHSFHPHPPFGRFGNDDEKNFERAHAKPDAWHTSDLEATMVTCDWAPEFLRSQDATARRTRSRLCQSTRPSRQWAAARYGSSNGSTRPELDLPVEPLQRSLSPWFSRETVKPGQASKVRSRPSLSLRLSCVMIPRTGPMIGAQDDLRRGVRPGRGVHGQSDGRESRRPGANSVRAGRGQDANVHGIIRPPDVKGRPVGERNRLRRVRGAIFVDRPDRLHVAAPPSRPDTPRMRNWRMQ